MDVKTPWELLTEVSEIKDDFKRVYNRTKT